MWPWIEIIIVMLILVLGLFTLKRIYTSGKKQKRIWRIFKEASEELGLEVKDGPVTDYGYPKLFGRYKGRLVYVHPTERKKQQSTVYAVQNALTFDGDVVITSPETTTLKNDINKLSVPSIQEKGLEIRSDERSNQVLANDIFSRGAVDRLKDLINKQAENFRAFILESGVCMFSKYKLPDDIDEIEETLEDVIKLADEIETNSDTFEVVNPRFKRISKKSRAVVFDIGMMIVSLMIGIVLILSSPLFFSWISINLGAMMILLSGVRISFILHAREWIPTP